MIFLQITLTQTEQDDIHPPTRCPSRSCRGTQLRLHQKLAKPVRDAKYQEVAAHRYRCMACGRTFRVYPHGVSRAHTSGRVKAVAVLLYRLGLSYGAVSAALEAWKVYLCKSQVYQAVKIYSGTAAQPRGTIFQSIHTSPLGGPFVLVKCLGQWVPLAMRMDETNRLAVTLRIDSRESLEQCYAAIAPIAAASGFDLQATDDTDKQRNPDAEQQFC